MGFLKSRTMLGVLCIVLSLLICFALTPLFNQSVSQKTQIVRVTKDIRAGEQITTDMVQAVEVGGFNLPESVLRQPQTVVGMYAKADLSAGDYILPTKLTDVPAAENAYLYSLTGEKQAISVSIKNFAGGLSGKLISGDIVSVIAPDYRKMGSTVIPPELTYVEVIGDRQQRYDTDTGEQSGDEDEKQLPATVTLLVSRSRRRSRGAGGGRKLHCPRLSRKQENAKFTELQDKVILALYPVPTAQPAEEETQSVTQNPTRPKKYRAGKRGGINAELQKGSIFSRKQTESVHAAGAEQDVQVLAVWAALPAARPPSVRLPNTGGSEKECGAADVRHDHAHAALHLPARRSGGERSLRSILAATTS